MACLEIGSHERVEPQSRRHNMCNVSYCHVFCSYTLGSWPYLDEMAYWEFSNFELGALMVWFYLNGQPLERTCSSVRGFRPYDACILNGLAKHKFQALDIISCFHAFHVAVSNNMLRPSGNQCCP